jgi:hypothetical protein
MNSRRSASLAVTIATFAAMGLAPMSAEAQLIGTFKWRTEPYCNVLTLAVAQNGSVLTLSGFDQPCGSDQRLPAQGLAVLQPAGNVTLGLTILSLPGGAPVSFEADISLERNMVKA